MNMREKLFLQNIMVVFLLRVYFLQTIFKKAVLAEGWGKKVSQAVGPGSNLFRVMNFSGFVRKMSTGNRDTHCFNKT